MGTSQLCLMRRYPRHDQTDGARSFSRLALCFAILTAVRSGEVRGAAWEEFDLDEKLWTISAMRMKASREHVIPLSAPALAVLERCRELRIGSRSFVFPGARGDAPMSDMTLTKLLHEMKEDVTAIISLHFPGLGQRGNQSPR